MHHYAFHIKDYQHDTTHLSNDEDLCYRRLLDMYYDIEGPIPLDTQSVSRRLRMGCDTVATVLREFFIESEKGWIHARCEQVISDYHAVCERNRQNGKAGGRPKKTQRVSSGNRVVTQRKANHKPETISHKPVSNPPIQGVNSSKHTRGGRIDAITGEVIPLDGGVFA